LVTDTTPDVPVRTSDLFLEQVLQNEAGLRKIPLEGLADGLLALAWKDRGRWEKQIRALDRIGEAYGTFSPRALAELKTRIEGLRSLSEELDTYEGRWDLSLDDLRKENLARFLDQSPVWKGRLDPKSLEPLDADARRGLLAELLAALEEFTKGHPDAWSRL